jgi:hypothetical protein
MMKISSNTVNASQPTVDGHRVDHVHPRPSPQVHYKDAQRIGPPYSSSIGKYTELGQYSH